MNRKQHKLPLVFSTRELPQGKGGHRMFAEEGTDHRERVWVICRRGLDAYKTNLQKRGIKPGDYLNAN